MLEQEWLASGDPQAMLRLVEKTSIEGLVIAIPRQPSFRVSDRKLRLFDCACCRQIWHLLDDKRSRHAVEVAERYADGLATQQELAAAWDAAWDTARSTARYTAWSTARSTGRYAAKYAAWDAVNATDSPTTRDAARKTQADLLRDIVGNPWRPITLPSHWLTPTVKALAQTAYDGRGETGHLDPDQLLILADTLEDAGCDCGEILRHLRGQEQHPDCGVNGQDLECVGCGVRLYGQKIEDVCRKKQGSHVRGCWVLDLLLGKE